MHIRTTTRTEIQLVCFDWGGVIIEICRSWSEALACAGLDPACITLDEKTVAAWKPRIRAVQTGEVDEYTFCEELAASVGVSAEQMLAAHLAVLKREYPGIAELVEWLHTETELATGLLSNTTALHYAQMFPRENGDSARFPTAGKLTHRLASHRTGYAKPDAEIYAAFEATSGYRGSEILFFDDLEENVAAARQVGWHAVHVDPTVAPAMQIGAALERYGVRA